jgi:two-component system NarL family sensor kinase
LPTKLRVEIGSCLYKVIQVGLRNVVKHSQTRRARVTLACKGSALRLNIKDAGVAFTPSSSKHMAGLGLESMRERVQLLGGTFSVQSQPGEGTEISIVGLIMQMWMALIWLSCGYGKRSSLKSCKRLGEP